MAARRHKTHRKEIIYFYFSLCLCVSAVSFSCSLKPTDLRALVPADTLIYLETNDLAAALQPIVDSKPFNEVAKSKPDLSVLKGVQLAIAVTGFETTEEKLTDEHSIGRIQPHFVAIADTHAWNYQAVKFAEQKLGAFVANIYDSKPKLEKSDAKGGKYFTWTADNGRKTYALVIDSLVYFGNDDTTIDKCLAVKRGEADSIARTGKVQNTDSATLASGYVSTDGIAQIANIIGLKFATEASDDSEVQSAIADILPQFIRNSITEVSWTMTKTEQGIEDWWQARMPPEVGSTFSETLVPASEVNESILAQFPRKATSVTVYNFKDPRIAWRTVLLTVQRQTDASSGNLIAELANMLAEPYGIDNPEIFLSGVNSTIVTGRTDDDGEETVMVAQVKEYDTVQNSLADELKHSSVARASDAPPYRTSKDSNLGGLFFVDIVILGSRDQVQLYYISGGNKENQLESDVASRIVQNKAPISTFQRDKNRAGILVDTLAERKEEHVEAQTASFTETRFTKTGIERRTVSDFGFIGWIIAQLAEN